ncbi:hypothetical protein P0082_06110 [Candidatus Haliotispira prima]|uniref:LPS-assembly protein LptD n=1 Tax=Candidatus Haliotispira prima TaxID=3034016 RepID=A0ABY8MFQ1_9SPIO|nr:hypothetical protein P0082_06110 [Candidatus Haliotispira prima]
MYVSAFTLQTKTPHLSLRSRLLSLPVLLLAVFLTLSGLVGPVVQVLNAQGPNSADSAGSADAAGDSEREERLRNLRTRAQQDDIATATYFELQELARKYGIEANQGPDTLRRGLYSKLNISAPIRGGGGAGNQENLVIKIESAQKAQAFTVERQEGDSENYFKISGGVRVFITDQNEGYEHNVSADSIIFNRGQNTIRAEGRVTYIKKKINSTNDKDTEKFTGDSLIFRLRVWRGVIFYGVFSRGQTTETDRPANVHSSSSNPEKTKSKPGGNTSVDANNILGRTVLAKNDIDYHFDSKNMRKGSDDILVLEKGEISTSEEEQTEYFRLGFHRLWIFGKPEWAMLSATLYVGHIPVLYLPYYYHNDSQLLFHPVFGIREAYGEFVQTTTYLLGTPKSGNTDSLSFLPVNSDSGNNTEFELDTLFLVPAKPKDPAEQQQKKKVLGAGSYLKFLLDYYSYIGLFTGFDGSLKNFGPITDLSLKTSLAYAFGLEERTGSGFATGKPYILDSDGAYRLKVIETDFFGLTIPFRYGIDTRLSTKNNTFKLDFVYYSDPFYRRDYFNRKESFDWLGYGLELSQRDVDNLLEEWRKKESLISSFKWQASLNLRPRFNTSLVSSFNFSAFVTSHFSKKTDTGRETYDPTREFFYPTKFFMPDTSLRVSGTLWPLVQNTQQNGRNLDLPILQDWKYRLPQEPDPGIGGPGSPGGEGGLVNGGIPIDDSIIKPKELQKIKEDQQVETVSFKATYNLALQNLMQSQTDNAGWTRIEDVAINNKELQFTGKEAFQVVTEWKFLDSLLVVNLKHSVNVNVTHYFDIADNESSSNDLDATKQATKWNWNEESSVVLKPLRAIDWFANSSITHSIKAVVYDYQYNTTERGHEGSFLDFGVEDTELRKRIPTHRFGALLDFHPIKSAYNPINNLKASFSLSSDLPPSVPKNTLKSLLFFEMFKWSHNLSIEFIQNGEDDPEFYPQPFNYTSIYRPIDKVQLKNVFIYNFEAKDSSKEGHIEREEISFRAWWFSGGLFFRYTQPYQWDTTALSWKADGSDDLLAEKVYLAFQLTTKDHYFWKNRVLFFFTFKTRWDQHLIRYNQTSSLTMDFTFSFFIHEFLNFQISYRMSHEKLYLYYPGMQDILGFSGERLILEDLLNSVSFWNEDLQKKGLFKMKDIRLLAIHHLKDWDLIFEFVGKPKQQNNNLAWDYALGFYLRWIPIPLLKRRATFQSDNLSTDAR